MINIVPFSKKYQQQVIELIVSIQAQEFGVAITADDQPDLKDIENYYQMKAGDFWIALESNKVVGTISLVDIGNNQGALRKMFVKKEYRGKPFSIGQKLLNTLFERCHSNNITEVFLGTVPNYFAAHKFYGKNGFDRINESALPSAFQIMEVDTWFFKKTLTVT